MLNEYRKQIDEIDKRIISLMEERLDVVREISSYKDINNINIKDDSREAKVIEEARSMSRFDNRDYIELLMRSIMDISKKMQGRLRKK